MMLFAWNAGSFVVIRGEKSVNGYEKTDEKKETLSWIYT